MWAFKGEGKVLSDTGRQEHKHRHAQPNGQRQGGPGTRTKATRPSRGRPQPHGTSTTGEGNQTGRRRSGQSTHKGNGARHQSLNPGRATGTTQEGTGDKDTGSRCASTGSGVSPTRTTNGNGRASSGGGSGQGTATGEGCTGQGTGTGKTNGRKTRKSHNKNHPGQHNSRTANQPNEDQTAPKATTAEPKNRSTTGEREDRSPEENENQTRPRRAATSRPTQLKHRHRAARSRGRLLSSRWLRSKAGEALRPPTRGRTVASCRQVVRRFGGRLRIGQRVWFVFDGSVRVPVGRRFGGVAIF